MPIATEAELRYAAEVVIPTIQIVYDRYQNGTSSVVAPNVQWVADIRADTRRLGEGEVTLDPASLKLVDDLVARPAADPTLLGTIGFDPTTSTGFVSFRGTKKGTEWADDFEGVPYPFEELGAPVAWVHRGFLDVWRLARPSVLAGLGQLPKVNRVLVTGHSLGSAIATLCALEIANGRPGQDVACWTLASPRVFHGRPKRFKALIHSSMRVHNPVDIVTNVPLLPFIHVQGGVAIKAKTKDFHSLMLTYQPGLEALLHRTPQGDVSLEPSEDEMVKTADDSPALVAVESEANAVTYVASGVWPIPDGVTRVTVEAWGGGGGGSRFGGGQGGGSFRATIPTPPSTGGLVREIHFDLGKGGAGGDSEGTDGGVTTVSYNPVGFVLNAYGGGGSKASASDPRAGTFDALSPSQIRSGLYSLTGAMGQFGGSSKVGAMTPGPAASTLYMAAAGGDGGEAGRAAHTAGRGGSEMFLVNTAESNPGSAYRFVQSPALPGVAPGGGGGGCADVVPPTSGGSTGASGGGGMVVLRW